MNSIRVSKYEAYRESDVIALYEAVGWTHYANMPESLRRAFASSLCTLGAWDGRTLVGLIRAVGDGVTIVYVQDLLVLPQYQGMGVGSALLQMMLNRFAGVRQFVLLCDHTPALEQFYERNGMTRGERASCGVMLRLPANELARA